MLSHRRRPRRDVSTLMITDISGSTAMASRLGDHHWSRLRSEHDVVVRTELGRWGGFEIDTSGDGFLATFDRPGHAVGCAASISDAVRGAGIDVRIGLHMGEVDAVDGRITGIAVHIGSRIARLAGAGEILATSTVRESMAGSTTIFDDRGTHVLAGVPGEWRIFSIRRDVAARPAEVTVGEGTGEIAEPAALVSKSVVALMFTDILGATKLLSEIGDEAWRKLLTQHDRILGRELKRYGGIKTDQAGDRVLATFERAGPAIDCAEAIMRAVKGLPIELRISVHIGEVESTGGKASGASVHVGARVLACAEAGEILVTSTAKDSLLGTGRWFEDRGFRQLKGLTEEWHLYRAIARV